MSNAGGYGMKRGLGNDGGLSRRRVGRLGGSGRLGLAGTAGTVLLVAGAAADPGISPAVAPTVRIGVGPGGAEGNGDSFGPSVSPDGHWAAFESSASNLVPGDANGPTVDVFVYHVDDQSLRLASVPAGG